MVLAWVYRGMCVCVWTVMLGQGCLAMCITDRNICKGQWYESCTVL